MKIKPFYKILEIIFVFSIILVFFKYHLSLISYGLPFFYNQDEIAFQGSILSSLGFLTGYFEINYNPYYAALLNLLLIINSILLNEFIINSLSLGEIKTKIYFNPEIFLFYGRVASLIITSISIFFLHLIFKKLKINFLIYGILLITFATSMEALNVSTLMSKNSCYLLIYLIQLYFLIKYCLKIQNFKFRSYLIFSLLGSFAWGVNYWPAYVSILAVFYLHYTKFQFSKINYLLLFIVIFIILGPVLNSFFINYSPIDHLLPDKQLEKFELSSYLETFLKDLIESFKIMFVTEKNIILLFLITPFFILNNKTKLKKEFLIISSLIFLPILLFSIGDDIPPQLRFFSGIICIILILTALSFNELYKLNFKFLSIILVISNFYFIYENIKMNNKIDNIISKKHSFYNFNNNIQKERSKILYMVDLNVQESLKQNLYYVEMYENNLIKKNEETIRYLKNIKNKIQKNQNYNDIIFENRDLKKDIIYFNYTYFPIDDLNKFFDYIKKDFEFVVIEESQPFHLSDKYIQKEIRSYVKENFLLEYILYDNEKIFLRNQQSVIHYYVGSLSRFDITENIYNDKLEVVYGTNYSLYKLK